MQSKGSGVSTLALQPFVSLPAGATGFSVAKPKATKNEGS